MHKFKTARCPRKERDQNVRFSPYHRFRYPHDALTTFALKDYRYPAEVAGVGVWLCHCFVAREYGGNSGEEHHPSLAVTHSNEGLVKRRTIAHSGRDNMMATYNIDIHLHCFHECIGSLFLYHNSTSTSPTSLVFVTTRFTFHDAYNSQRPQLCHIQS